MNKANGMVTVVNESGERSFLFDSVFSEGRQEDPREENDEGIESRRLLMKSIYSKSIEVATAKWYKIAVAFILLIFPYWIPILFLTNNF